MSDLKQIVSENFARYAGNVILDRAICDARDLLKPSARMLMYSQLHITKNIPSKPFVKSARVVGDCLGRYYTHGDGSCYATYMRMAKPFAMRYPLEDCQGNSGTITETGDEAASRYTELRLSKLGARLFEDIEKEIITEWSDNFDETETYPKVLGSKGYYNICNGSQGIGVSLSASIPQFNLKDINEAMIKLINDPSADIDILPDFATGALLINADQVRESLKNGTGFACKLRSVVEFDPKQKAFIVKELPYGVYTNTISGEIQKLVEADPECGVDHINDGSGKTPDYVIYLTKKANPDKVLKLLYKETSLQSFFSINMNVLVDGGRRPQTLGLREMLIAHIDHEKIVYRRGFEFDLRKILARLHIIEGLMKAYDMIDEVVQTIKSSASTAAASIALQKLLTIDEVQAKAILDLKLSKLSKLDISKLRDEANDLEQKRIHITQILESEELFNNELIKGWREVAETFGDARRTKILNLSEDADNETIEEKQLSISFNNAAALWATTTSTLYRNSRNSVGSKFKLKKGEYIINNLVCKNTDTLLIFTSRGNFYHIRARDINLDELVYLSAICPITENEKIVAVTSLSKENPYKYICFITKNGILKKSSIEEYNLSRNVGAAALKLDENDEIKSVLFLNNEKIGIATKNSNFIIIETEDIRSIGRVARGVQGIKLNPGDSVVCANRLDPNARAIISVTEDGYIKSSPIDEIKVTGRATKGRRIQNTDCLQDFIFVYNSNDLLITSETSQLRLRQSEVPELSLSAQGVKSLKLKDSKILKLETV